MLGIFLVFDVRCSVFPEDKAGAVNFAEDCKGQRGRDRCCDFVAMNRLKIEKMKVVKTRIRVN